MSETVSSNYLLEEMREFSLYTLQHRALPAITDGLKAGARRIMWIAKKQDKWKCATLAGSTMCLHPHGDSSLETAINTLAAPYGNNHPLLDGIGSFGTRLSPTAYGASRYTSVKISNFAKDAFYVDMDLIPMTMNYDNTLEEPVHFLPLIPMALVNPVEGVAVGFASDILPRKLSEIINAQISILEGKKIRKYPNIWFKPLNAESLYETEDGKYVFEGKYTKEGNTYITITDIPYGVSHDSFVKRLNELLDDENSPLKDYSDNSKDVINIKCKMDMSWMINSTHEKIIDLFKLQKKLSENMNMVDITGKKVMTTNFHEVVEVFTNWRLTFYKKRYEKLALDLTFDLERLQDIIKAIDNNVGGKAAKIKDKAELKELLVKCTIKHVDYIASLPVYRFIIEERNKVEKQINEMLSTLSEYNKIINSPELQVEQYKKELKQLAKNY